MHCGAAPSPVGIQFLVLSHRDLQTQVSFTTSQSSELRPSLVDACPRAHMVYPVKILAMAQQLGALAALP